MGLTRRGKCRKKCLESKQGKTCACPKDYFYFVEFPVVDDGKVFWLGRGVPGARLKRWRTGTAKRKAAQEQEALIQADLMKGLMKSGRQTPILFAEWAKTYLSLEQVRTLRSYKDREDSVQTQLVPFFGRKALIDITATDVEAFRMQRRVVKDDKTSRMPAVATVNADHAYLKHMLSIAERRGLVPSNAAKRVPLPNPNNERDRILTADEWGKLYAAAPDHLKPVLLVAYQLGPRLSEILLLTWDRVDLQRGFIKLRAIDTKTKEGRLVPLTPAVLTMLRELAKVRSLTTNNVFLYEGRPMKRLKRAFRTACKAAGLTNFRFHDLRHCAATNLRRAGVDAVTAMRIVGHKSEKMHRRYNTVEEGDLVAAASKLNTYLTPPVEQPTTQTASA